MLQWGLLQQLLHLWTLQAEHPGRNLGLRRIATTAKVRNGKMLVTVCLDFHNKVPHTGWLTNNRNSFLTLLDTGKSKMKTQVDSVSGESLLSGTF